MNIFETKDGHILEAEMPGVSKVGLEITLEGNELTIVGHRPSNAVNGQLLCRESQDVVSSGLRTRPDHRQMENFGQDGSRPLDAHVA